MKSHHYQKRQRYRLIRYNEKGLLPAGIWSLYPIPAKEDETIIGYWVCQ